MKKTILLNLILLLLLACCGNNAELQQERNRTDSLQVCLDSLAAQNNINRITIARLRDSVVALSFPPSDRLAAAQTLFRNGALDSAQNAINQLRNLFPNTTELVGAASLQEQIDARRETERREAERREILAIKALPQSKRIVVDYNTINVSDISVGDDFRFNSYGNHCDSLSADSGYKFIRMSMSVTSTNDHPKLPEFAIYRIIGSEMQLEIMLFTHYARWRDYEAYLGNYNDDGNDFAKTNTVHFKLGMQVPVEVASGPFAIVMHNSNVLTEEYNPWDSPCKSWSGHAPFTRTLNIQSFESGEFTLIKIFNLR